MPRTTKRPPPISSRTPQAPAAPPRARPERPADDNMIRGAIVREMARTGLSQSELARRVGWPQQHISRYIIGVHDLSTRKAGELIRALRLSIVADADAAAAAAAAAR